MEQGFSGNSANYGNNGGAQFAQQGGHFADSRARLANNSRLWFAAVIPLLSLLIEVYADCFALGVVVWSCCVVSWTAACLADRRCLRTLGLDVSRLNPLTAVLPPLYIIKRCALTHSSKSPALVFVIMAFYAAVFNGFSDGLTMNEEDMISQVRDNIWTNISNVATLKGADTAGFIGDSLDSAAGESISEEFDSLTESSDSDSSGKFEEYIAENFGIAPENSDGENGGKGSDDREWTAERNGDTITVIFKRGQFEMEFEEVFDGFTFTSLRVVRYRDGTGEYTFDPDGDNTVFDKFFTSFFGTASQKSKEEDSSSDSEESEISDDGVVLGEKKKERKN